MRHGVNACAGVSAIHKPSRTYFATNDIRKARKILEYYEKQFPEFLWTIGTDNTRKQE